MILLAILSIVSATSVHAIASTNLDEVMCYVCQWSSKSGYTSPMLQPCQDSDIANNRKNYVQKCKTGSGCAVSRLYEGTNLIGISRSCSSVNANSVTSTRYCRGGDCTAQSTGSGTSLAGNIGDSVSCRIVAAGSSTTDISNTTATVCGTDKATTLVYCTRSQTSTDIVVDGFPNTFNSPSYELKCTNLPRTFWTASEYTVNTMTCVNSLCNKTDHLKATSILIFIAAFLTKCFV